MRIKYSRSFYLIHSKHENLIIITSDSTTLNYVIQIFIHFIRLYR